LKPRAGYNLKTDRVRSLPPLYTHPIGSLPRPQVVRDLLARRVELEPDRFQGLLDDAVRFAIHLQELSGLDVISDGEWRRVQYIREFLQRIGGFERCRRYEHQGELKVTEVVVRRMSQRDPVFANDARFLATNTDHVTKFALPSPFLIAIRYWHPDYSADAYHTVHHFIDHLAELIRQEAQAVVASGIDIIQIDDPALTYYCDTELLSGRTHDERLRRQWRPNEELPRAISAINWVVEGLHAEVHLHCCHSVYKRTSDVRGSYKPLLPYLSDAKVDRLNLEFAYPGTGDLSDLSLVPDHLCVGLGVIDVRSEQIQAVEEIVELAQRAVALLGADRIALNPDCGFAPDAGEPPTIDEAYEKLCRLVAAAKMLR
jgi:5-methyltetrahydropteroyltriglutamate--homocysteine methyltransferase